MTSDLDVIQEGERAQALLHPARLELLENLEVPSSPAALARRLGLPRQRVNYHLRELEGQRLVEVAGERRRGSILERTYRRTASSYAISPAALGRLGARPEAVQDHFSSAYQLALAARVLRELGAQRLEAERAGLKLPTFALDAEVRFATPEARHAFGEELATAVADLVRRYHDESAPNGRSFRLFLGAHPRPPEGGG